MEDWAVQQLWMFWLVQLIGALVAGLVYKVVIERRRKPGRRSPAAEADITGRAICVSLRRTAYSRMSPGGSDGFVQGEEGSES